MNFDMKLQNKLLGKKSATLLLSDCSLIAMVEIYCKPFKILEALSYIFYNIVFYLEFPNL